MSEQSANSRGSVESGWQPSPVTASPISIGTARTLKTEATTCPECGEHVHRQTGACPGCGEDLGHSPKQIRCMHCSTPASSELVICPGCGRELREAPPKFMTMGAPALLALLLLVLIATQWDRASPIMWARSNLVRGVTLVEDLGASIEPEVLIVMTPIIMTPIAGDGVDNGIDNSNSVVVVADAPVVSDGPVVVALIAAEPTPASVSEDATLADASVADESPVGVGGPQLTKAAAEVEEAEIDAAQDAGIQEALTDASVATAIIDATPVPPATQSAEELESARMGDMAAAMESDAESPSNTPTPTWTVQVTGQSTVQPTSQATSQAVVQPVDTASSNASAALVAVPATVTSTPSAEAAGGVARVAGLSANGPASQSSTVPSASDAGSATATPIVVASPSPTPTVTPVVYQVRPGDTLVTIAARYNVEVEALMDVNEISAQEVFAIQPGQMLFVPVAVPVETAASAAISTTLELRVEAPKLVLPVEAATIGCRTGGILVWQRVQFVKDSDKYVLHLGFVNGRSADGQENVAWVVSQAVPVTMTEWSLDTSLCDLAPAEFGNQWRWWVEVAQQVDGRLESVSPPSAIRGFTWN
jgi:LysM repeat protein